MKFLVKEIFFDVDDDDITLEEYNEVVQDSLGVWEASDHDDLIEEITCNSGWCIKSIDYDIQLKQPVKCNLIEYNITMNIL